MNTSEINTLLRKECGKKFIGVYARDNLPTQLPPRRPLLLVVNTDRSNRKGQHWVCMCIEKTGQYSEYFDSIGMAPLTEFEMF